MILVGDAEVEIAVSLLAVFTDQVIKQQGQRLALFALRGGPDVLAVGNGLGKIHHHAGQQFAVERGGVQLDIVRETLPQQLDFGQRVNRAGVVALVEQCLEQVPVAAPVVAGTDLDAGLAGGIGSAFIAAVQRQGTTQIDGCGEVALDERLILFIY